MKYEKVEIIRVEAAKFTGMYNSNYPDWLNKILKEKEIYMDFDGYHLRVDEDILFNVGDWIVRDDRGQLSICSDKSFKERYREVK